MRLLLLLAVIAIGCSPARNEADCVREGTGHLVGHAVPEHWVKHVDPFTGEEITHRADDRIEYAYVCDQEAK